MPIRITVDEAATWGANYVLQGENANASRKNQVLAVKKYNLLVTAFNASTILLITAVAAAILFAYPASFTLGAIGLFIRATTEKELESYCLPLQNRDISIVEKILKAVARLDEDEKVANIFKRVKLDFEEGWEIDQLIVFDYSIWKNKITEPKR